MRYHGGKSRTGKNISELLKELITNNSLIGYCEPFCGACGVLSHMSSLNTIDFLAGDINPSLICMWKSLQEGWVPDLSNVTRERFLELKGDGSSSAEKGFIGHVVTYGGQYFKYFTESLTSDSRLSGSKRSVISISSKMENVEFSCGGYNQYDHIEGYLIFCDPPYEKTSYYFDESNRMRKFDSSSFWEWCAKMSKKNVIVVNEMSDINKTGWTKLSLPSREITYFNYKMNSKESLFVMNNIKTI